MAWTEEIMKAKQEGYNLYFSKNKNGLQLCKNALKRIYTKLDALNEDYFKYYFCLRWPIADNNRPKEKHGTKLTKPFRMRHKYHLRLSIPLVKSFSAIDPTLDSINVLKWN